MSFVWIGYNQITFGCENNKIKVITNHQLL